MNLQETKRLATKFVYYLYVSRTFSTSNIKFFKKNSNNTMTCNVTDNVSNGVFDERNIKKLMSWLVSNEEDYLEIKRYDYD